MKQQFFGLRKAPINRLLKQIKLEYTLAKTDLKLDLEKLMLENKQLETELEVKSTAVYEQESQDEIWNYGKMQMTKVIEYLDEKKNMEIEEIQLKYNEKINEINEQLVAVDAEIQTLNEIFSDLVDQFTQKINQPMDRTVQQEVASSISVDIKENKELLYLFDEEIEQNLIRTEETQAASQKEKAIEEVNLFPFSKENESIPSSLINAQPHTNGTDFWGDIEEFKPEGFSFFKESSTASNEFFRLNEEFTEKVMKQEERSEVPLSMDTSKKEVQTEAGQPLKIQESEPHSDTLLAQIDSIKTQYIVGKVAGEDLYDLEGNIIVAKNCLITREVVEHANRIGKLAELIVNMKLTGGLG